MLECSALWTPGRHLGETSAEEACRWGSLHKRWKICGCGKPRKLCGFTTWSQLSTPAQIYGRRSVLSHMAVVLSVMPHNSDTFSVALLVLYMLTRLCSFSLRFVYHIFSLLSFPHFTVCLLPASKLPGKDACCITQMYWLQIFLKPTPYLPRLLPSFRPCFSHLIWCVLSISFCKWVFFF